MNPQIDSYIAQARTSGQNDEQIKQALAQSGWGQSDINQAFGIPNPPKAVTPPPAPGSAAAILGGDFLDEKTKQSIIWSVVGDFARTLIIAVGGSIAAYMFVPQAVSLYGFDVPLARPGFSLNIGAVIINSLIFGALAGIILSKWYSGIQKLNQQYLGGRLNTIFKLFFYPSIVGSILSLVFAGGLSYSFFGGGTVGSYVFMSLIVSIVASVIGSYVYAKLMDTKVGKYYQNN